MIPEAQFSLNEPTVIVAPTNFSGSDYRVLNGTEIFIIPNSRPAINNFIDDLNKVPLLGLFFRVLFVGLLIIFGLIGLLITLALTQLSGAWIIGIIIAVITVIMVIFDNISEFIGLFYEILYKKLHYF